MKRVAGLLLVAALAGCVPASPDYPGYRAPKLATDMETIFGERPVWEQAPVAVDEDVARGDVYIIKPGDTGIAIARAYGVPWVRIVEANGLSEPYLLKVGQRLRLPGAETPEDQSLEARASAFKLDIEDILTGGEPAEIESAAAPISDPTAPLPPRIAVREPANFTGQFAWPITGSVVGRFGPVAEGQVNQGLEIATDPAAPIRASSDGVVAFVGNNVAGYGGMILIRHGGGWITAYGRAARTTVTRGQSVKRGDVIGATGSGAGPRLHFQMRKNRVPVDPLGQLPPA